MSVFERDSERAQPPAAPAPPDSGQRDGSGTLDTALRILRRQWWIILAAALIVGTVAYLYSNAQEKQYTATASVLFQPDVEASADQGRDFVDPEREAATNEALLSLPGVARGAAERLNIAPGTVASSVEVVSTRESDIVDIEATTTSPQLSMRMVNAYGQAFIALRRASARERLDNAIRGARNALNNLTDLQRQGQPGADIRQRLNQFETSRALLSGGADLVQPADTPTEPSAPKPGRSGLLGGIVGALLGLAIAGLRERRDRSVKDVEEIEVLYGRPVIAEIPRARALARSGLDPIGPEELEAFRTLRSSLRYFSVDVATRSLLIASAAPGEGKSTIARRLAETMASMGDSVVLVEADMHRTSIFEVPDAAGDFGLSTVLIGRDLDESFVEVAVASGGATGRTLTVLPNGPLPPNPSVLLESERMREVLLELRSRFDTVIIDSPPLPIVSDALPLIDQVDGVLAVSGLGIASRDGIRELLRLVSLHGDNLLGVVVNFTARSDRSAAAYYRGHQS